MVSLFTVSSKYRVVKGGVSIMNHERIFPQITNHVCLLCNFTNYVFSYVMTENDSRKLLDLRCIFSDFSW